MKKKLKFLKMFIVILLLVPLAISNINSTNKHINEKILSAAKTLTKVSAEDDKIEEITADCVFSVGSWCICADSLQRNGLRKTASPLDWMRKYSLDTVATLFETKFKDFFKNAKVTKKRNDCNNRTLYDTKNHIESIHYIPTDAPFDEEYQLFIETMQNRAAKVDNIISSSKSALLINCREDNDGNDKNSTDRELKKFSQRFSKIYPNLEKIYLIDVHNDKNKKIRKRIVYNDKKIKIIQYKFKNIDNKNFQPNWRGNQKAWNKIMKSIHLTKNTND